MSAENGLSESQAQDRLRHFGPNELRENGSKSPLVILWAQLSSVLVIILILTVIVTALLGETVESLAIGVIVIMFAVLGFVQEYRAERSMAALRQLATPLVRARRDGRTVELPAHLLVPGDEILLEAGSLVPADARLIESANLRVLESVLTGESEPVEKMTDPLTGDMVALGDRRNMVYMGTSVTYGRGTAVVTATGMSTELGRIAGLLQGVKDETTPLQRQLAALGNTLALAGLIVAGLVLVIGLLLGETAAEMFTSAVSVAVAVVPEGLPAVVTITLSLGARRMFRRQALIRKLPAVETLGSVTTICTDKTGTLTENRMALRAIQVPGQELVRLGPGEQELAHRLSNPILLGGMLCNDATCQMNPVDGQLQLIGDPTEQALLEAGQQAGLDQTQLAHLMPRVAELPFDAERKRMTTVHRIEAESRDWLGQLAGEEMPYLAVTKGAPEGLLEKCDAIWVHGQTQELDASWRAQIEAANERLAQDGMRVLGIAARPQRHVTAEEAGLTFLGLLGLVDPPRPEAKAAVTTAQKAGIRPIMITGDHPATALAIGRQLGITSDQSTMTGPELDGLADDELVQVVAETAIFARVTPEHKLRIVQALQEKGEIVAMTGDGVNDAPALKKADIGIAMGITGTDVSKEAAAMVLLNDNFATIVAAVEEGRAIYDNIRRFVKFSVGGNLGKVLVMLLAPLFGPAVALLPLQLLWLNLLTDGLLGFGLGVEPGEKGIMKRPPHAPTEKMVNKHFRQHVLWVGGLIGFITLGVGYAFYDAGNPVDKTWQTMMFTTLAFLQVGQALASRSSRDLPFGRGLIAYPALPLMALLVIGLQLTIIYVPFFEAFLGVVPLSMAELALCALLGSLIFIAIELEKWLASTRSLNIGNRRPRRRRFSAKS